MILSDVECLKNGVVFGHIYYWLEAKFDEVDSVTFKDLGYLTLPYGEGVLPTRAEASSGPNAHPRINP